MTDGEDKDFTIPRIVIIKGRSVGITSFNRAIEAVMDGMRGVAKVVEVNEPEFTQSEAMSLVMLSSNAIKDTAKRSNEPWYRQFDKKGKRR